MGGSAAVEDPTLPPCGDWKSVQPQGAVCSDGSPYKFFVNYSATSDNLLVMFEPGGACFDFASCSGQTRSTANRDGIPDDHISRYPNLNLLRRTVDNPVRDWNMVFVSYCTGDVFGGDRVAQYADPDGGPTLTYRHVGALNTQKVIEYLQPRFTSIEKLLVTGCSAGGTAATENYALIREALPGTQRGYLLDDSGPIFHSAGPSGPLHAATRALWHLDPLLERLAGSLGIPSDALKQDFGQLHTALADRFPQDRFAFTAYQRDLNYSLYSYATFDPTLTANDIHALWLRDLSALMETYDSRANLAYYIPFFRQDNCSHCVSIAPLDRAPEVTRSQPWLGSEIAADALNLRDFIETLFDDSPVRSYFETEMTGGFSEAQASMCFARI